jgi:hypothetical protein
LADGARTTNVVTEVVVRGSALRKSRPVSIGVNLNSVASDTGGAAACLPRNSSSASSRSGGDNSSSRSGGNGVDTRRRPRASGASNSSHLEGDRVTTAVKSAAELVKREAVGSLAGNAVESDVLPLSCLSVLEFVSDGSIAGGVGSPVNVHTVSGRI